MNAPRCLSFRPVIELTLVQGVLAAGISLAGLGPVFPSGEFPAQVPVPENNPMPPRQIAPGKQLYFDPRLSLTASVSCVSCNRVTSSGTDGLLFFSFGVLGRVDVPRHVLTVFNAVFNTVQFWDGRAKSLDRPRDGTPPRASSGSRKLGDGPTFP